MVRVHIFMCDLTQRRVASNYVCVHICVINMYVYIFVNLHRGAQLHVFAVFFSCYILRLFPGSCSNLAFTDVSLYV